MLYNKTKNPKPDNEYSFDIGSLVPAEIIITMIRTRLDAAASGTW